MSRRPALTQPIQVAELLVKILKPGDLRAIEARTRIRQAWEHSLGDLLPQTKLLDYKNNVLWVEVSSSPWMQEFQFLKPRILQSLHNLLGPKVISDLRFRLRGEIE